MTFHPVLSPSPLEKAFCYVASQSSSSSSSGGFLSDATYRDNGDNNDDDAENDLPPFWLSPPEVSLLRSAEENPLEYTLAEPDDAVSYVRILLKMLDQVTNTSSSSSSTQPQHNNLHNNARTHRNSGYPSSTLSNHNIHSGERILTLDTPLFSEDEAFDLYYRSTKQHKRLVVAHYCVTKIYEIICVSLDSQGSIPSVSKLFHGTDAHGKDANATKTHHRHPTDDSDDGLDTIHLEKDEWVFLLKLLYNRSSDEYTKRGSALILAFILQAGCQLKTNSSTKTATKATKPDEDLLDLFADEHKTSSSPSTWIANSNNNSSSRTQTSVIDDTLESLISWLTSRLQRSGTYASLGVVTPTLGVLLSTTRQARLAFCQSGGIGYISRHLREKRQRPPPVTPSQQRLWPKQPSSTTSPTNSNHNTNSTTPSSNTARPQPAAVMLPKMRTSPARQRNGRTAATATSSTLLPLTTSPSPKTSPRVSTKSLRTTFAAYSRDSLSQSGSFASSVSSNLGLSELDLMMSFPSTEEVKEKLDNTITTASEAAARAAAMARSAAPEALASLAASVEVAPPKAPATTTISSSASVQQLYDLVFCLWCLSLDCATDETVLKHFVRDGAVPALAHLLKKVPREKVLRVTLASLRSLSTLSGNTSADNNNQINNSNNNDQPFVREMIGCGVLKSLENVKLRRWNDVDLEEDLEFLRTLLADRTEELTQWSAYEAQIQTGILRWDEMLHTHDFFRANAKHMEGRKGDFAPLKRLVEVLYSNTTSGKLRSSGRANEISYVGLNEVGGWDEEDLRDDEISETLAVCLFDIGEFARNYPNGKAVLGNRCGIGAKALIMQYVHHPRDDVREQALLCASKMLVRNWRAIEQ